MVFKVNSCLFNYQYNGRRHFPFSIALLVSHIKNNKNISTHFEFEKTFIVRDKIDEYIQRCKDTDILLCSCYTWNWEITMKLASEVKKINPNCLIICGGPQVPNRSEKFFEEYSFIDILVHGEGEIVLENIFSEYINKKNYLNVKGIETKDFRNEPQPRINDLTTLSSPYLTNIIWEITDRNDSEKWACLWETHRGCPYSCTFCDWGSAVNTKTRKFSDERLFAEMDWFSENKVTQVECCDANFGIFGERDLRIASKLKELALTKGYPNLFRTAWAKVSSEKIIPMAKELQNGGLLLAVTLSLQSLDETALETIKRANLKFSTFSDLVGTFRKSEIPTYTELIRGLPGETLESFKKGLEDIMNAKIGTVYIYNCGVFVNAPMNEPAYRDYNKIETIRSPIYLAHSSVNQNEIPEFENLTIGTSSYTYEELKEMYYFSWMVQTLHSFGILEYIATYYQKTNDLALVKFYEIFLEFCRKENSIFSKEYEKLVKYVDDGYSGKGWNASESDFGEINWPFEEISWARLLSNKNNLEEGIELFMDFLEKLNGYNTDEKLLRDLRRFQIFLLSSKDNSLEEIKKDSFEYNWKNYFADDIELKLSQVDYSYKKLVLEKDQIQWAFKTIWWGRTTKNFKFLPEQLSESQSIEKMTAKISK
jgi:radical SAM superfamily enzyme YgiQ (UPF0313 family)